MVPIPYYKNPMQKIIPLRVIVDATYASLKIGRLERIDGEIEYCISYLYAALLLVHYRSSRYPSVDRLGPLPASMSQWTILAIYLNAKNRLRHTNFIEYPLCEMKTNLEIFEDNSRGRYGV